MNNFFAELKRRNVVRVAIAYAVVSWVVIQIGDIAADNLAFPEWFMPMVFVVLGLGFPIVLIFSWAYEVTPEGVMKTEEVDASESITHGTGQKINKLIIGGLVLAVGFLLYDKFMIGPNQPIVEEAEAARTSIAVLPFVNMSSDPEQEYFSDGITEELLNTLAKVPGLLVAARTSAFSYKGQNKDVREIGRELGVTMILEGSVRKAGNDLRITAQLIRVSDGFHLWSETYDRKLENVFAIQEEIAFAIGDALKTPLGLAPGGLVTSRTRNMAAYDLYLKGLGQLKQRGPGLAEGVVTLRQALELDPNFGPAWAVLAITYQVLPTYVTMFEGQRPTSKKFNILAEEAAARALALDPGTALAHQAMGTFYRTNMRWAEAEDEYLKALAIDPQSASVLEDYNEFLDLVGFWDKSIEYGLLAARLEPFRPVFHAAAGYSYLSSNRLAEAEEVFDHVLTLDPTFANAILVKAEIRVLEGNYQGALAVINACPDCVMPDREIWLEALTHLINGTQPSENQEAYYQALNSGVIFALFGKDGMLEAMEFITDEGYTPAGYTQFDYPFMTEVRADPRYKALVQRIGLVDYWRQRGWPKYCQPIGDDDFECD